MSRCTCVLPSQTKQGIHQIRILKFLSEPKPDKHNNSIKFLYYSILHLLYFFLLITVIFTHFYFPLVL